MKKLFETLSARSAINPNAVMQAIVRGKNEYGEYVVKLYATLQTGTYEEEGARYFTDDLEDACGTACAMVAHHACICPACNKSKLDPVRARNATSRYLHNEYICTECATREAFEGPFWKAAAEAWDETLARSFKN